MSTPPPSTPDDVRQALRNLSEGRDLSETESRAAFSRIMAGEVDDRVLAAFLTALRVKGETAAELVGAVGAVQEAMRPFHTDREVLDTCGTGGDGANTVNVSTAAAIVVAAGGVPVAKHGNRAATGNSGSSEVLTELGIGVEAEPDVLSRCLEELGATFLFAPKFHPALRHAGPVRRLLPFRTIFNLIGPLANPARPAFQLVGVAGDRQAALMAATLAALGLRRGAVVTGGDGLDEVTLDAPTRVRWIEGGAVTERVWEPSDFGLPRVTKAELRVEGPAESARRISAMLAGEAGSTRWIVLANAAAALLVADRVATLRDGVVLAAEAIDSGAATRLLDSWRRLVPVS